jgi:heme exporter protein D
MAEFFSMGDYGFYVWGSYLSALILIGAEVALLVRRKNALKREASSITGTQSVDNHSSDNTYEASS